MNDWSADDGHLGDLLSALVDGELSAAERSEAERHLAGCADCRAEQAATRRARDLVAGLPTLTVPPPVWAALMAAPDGRTATGRRAWARGRARAAVWAATGVAAAALAALAVSPPRHHVTPQMAHLVEVHAVSSGSDPVTQLAPAAVQSTSLSRP